MQATGTQGTRTRACVPTERVEPGRCRVLGAPWSGLRMGAWRAVRPAGGARHRDVPVKPLRTGAGCGSRGRGAMPRLPIAGGLAGTTRPTAASDGMAGGRPGRESPNPHLCAKIGGGNPDRRIPRCRSRGGCGQPAGSGGGRSAGRQATTPATEGLSPAGHACPAHQGARPPSPEGAPPVPQARAPRGRAGVRSGRPRAQSGPDPGRGCDRVGLRHGFRRQGRASPCLFLFLLPGPVSPQGGLPCLPLSDGIENRARGQGVQGLNNQMHCHQMGLCGIDAMRQAEAPLQPDARLRPVRPHPP